MPLPGDQHRDTPASANPFAPVEPKLSAYTAQEIATLQSRLDKQLGPEYISTRQGAAGGKVHYLAGEKAINLANDVFGFNGWSSGIQNVQIDFVDENRENGKISLGLSTIVRVTLRDGTYHEDIGYGHIENCKGKAAAFEKAKKEAATDALKRALRNFGNVLGNCLYDKDYLQRVTKLKSGPSLWSHNNLHRHPDFVPRESIQDANAKQDAMKAGNAVGRTVSLQSRGSLGSTEFEEDYGGNLFDEADLSHPDEVKLDDTTELADTPAKRAVEGSHHRQAMQRVSSMPHLRPPNIPPSHPRPNHLQEQSPTKQNFSGAAPSAVPQGQRMPPPQTSGPQVRPAQQTNGAQAPPQQADGPIARPNPSSGSATSTSSGNAPQRGPHGQAQSEAQDEQYRPPQPQAPPPGVPEGFVNARGVDLYNQPSNAKTVNAEVAFDPLKEPLSIRKTHGVNPGKTGPVRKDVTNQPQYPLPPGAKTRAGSPMPPPHVQQQQPPVVNMQPQSGPVNAAGGHMRNTNFVNPSADPTRRIGMPPSSAGSMQNRSNYRPPTPMKRPPLSDVSNLQQHDGAADAKKAKIDAPTVAAEAGEEVVLAAT